MKKKGDQRQASLHDEHAHRRQDHAPPQGRGKHDRGHAVERRLDGEQRDVATCPVEEGAEHRQRTDAEDQAGGDEGEAYPARFATTAHPALRPRSDRPHAVIEPEQFAEHDTDEHADQQDQRIVRFERHLYADHGDEETDGRTDRLVEAGGDDPPECEADGGAGEHGARVERGPEPGDQSFSKRSTLTMKTVAPPTWTSTGYGTKKSPGSTSGGIGFMNSLRVRQFSLISPRTSSIRSSSMPVISVTFLCCRNPPELAKRVTEMPRSLRASIVADASSPCTTAIRSFMPIAAPPGAHRHAQAPRVPMPGCAAQPGPLRPWRPPLATVAVRRPPSSGNRRGPAGERPPSRDPVDPARGAESWRGRSRPVG